MNLYDIRNEYTQRELSKQQCADNPINQFEQWLNEAITAQVLEPTAMNIATVDKNNQPHARMVLLKEVNQQGFVFFTNYLSHKGLDLSHHAFAALTFFWKELERQVRVEGCVEKLPEAQSDDYFASRPYSSRIGAWASEQSQTIANKQVIIARAAMFGAKYALHVPRPPHWGGYIVIPNKIEFWQGRPSRLHDRIEYVLNNNLWHKQRLAP